jgi:putative oxidoreductase
MNDRTMPVLSDDLGKLVLRLVLGALLLFHGVNKLLHGITPIQDMLLAHGLPGIFAHAVYLGEVLGPVLLMLGWYARIGAGLIVVNMLVALLLVHSGDFLMLTPQGGWRLELQGMYLFGALALLFMGPGRLAFNQR